MNDHMVVFHDGSRKEVSAEIAETLMVKSCDPGLQGVKINGAFYKFSTIAKILPFEEFYRQYPDERPEERKEFSQEINLQVRRPTERAKELMLTGMKKYLHETGREAQADVWIKNFFYGAKTSL